MAAVKPLTISWIDMAPKTMLNLAQWNTLLAVFVTHIKHHVFPESDVAEQSGHSCPQLPRGCTRVIRISPAGQFCYVQDQSCASLHWIWHSLITEPRL